MASRNPQVMVDMVVLQAVLNAAHDYYAGKGDSILHMLYHQADPSNPITKLRNQYNASVELYHAPEETFHQTA